MKGLIIIPTYNEAENIPNIVPEVLKQDKRISVLVVDDGSPDGTADLVKKMMETTDRIHLLEREKKNGLGRAYIAGFKYAMERDFDFVMEMDADFSHSPDELHLFFEAVEDGCEAVYGSRYINGVRVLNWPLTRLFISVGGSVYARFATGVKLTDMTGGFNLFTRKVLTGLDLDKIKSNGYAFQIEMKSKCAYAGFKTREVPIIFRDRFEGQTKMSGGIINEAVFKCWGFRFEKRRIRKEVKERLKEQSL